MCCGVFHVCVFFLTCCFTGVFFFVCGFVLVCFYRCVFLCCFVFVLEAFLYFHSHYLSIFPIVFFAAGVTTPDGMIGDEEYERAIEDEYERVMLKTKHASRLEERERLIQLGGGERDVF